jgi:hypothetical protein
VFAENPGLLEGRSNQGLLDRWLKDHAGQKEVPQKVKANLQNIKSVLRKQKRKRKGGRPKKVVAAPAQTALASPPTAPAAAPASRSKLEGLLILIDDCLVAARGLDAEGRHDVIRHLRRARNLIV